MYFGDMELVTRISIILDLNFFVKNACGASLNASNFVWRTHCRFLPKFEIRDM